MTVRIQISSDSGARMPRISASKRPLSLKMILYRTKQVHNKTAYRENALQWSGGTVGNSSDGRASFMIIRNILLDYQGLYKELREHSILYRKIAQ